MTFTWTPEKLAKARRLYVDETMAPVTVARCIGVRAGCTAALVLAAAQVHGWEADRTLKRYNWTPDQLEAVRLRYVDRGMAPAAIAAELGRPWTSRKVKALAGHRGWSAARPAHVTQAIKCAVLLAARDKAAAGRAASPNMKPPPGRTPRPMAPKDVPADLRALIDAAISAGKLQVLPPAYAAGLSAMETRFWAAGAGGSSWRRFRFGGGS